MKTVFVTLIMSFSYAHAAPSVACFQNDSPLSIQLAVQQELNDLGATLAEVGEDDFNLIAYMSNSEVKESNFQEMISNRKVDVMVFPEGKPDESGDSLHVVMDGDRAVVTRDTLTFKFDSCSWQH